MTKRLEYIDALRGFTMMLVIVFHLGGPIPLPEGGQQIINHALELVRMPLFFFISGFLIYTSSYSQQLLKRRIGNRLLRQLYPTLALGALYCITCTDISLVEMWYSFNKGGYWFTFVSVELFIFIAPFVFLSVYYSFSKHKTICLLFFWGVGAFVVNQLGVKYGWTQTKIWRFFNLYHFTYYLIFFVSGCVFRILYNNLKNIISNRVFFLLR